MENIKNVDEVKKFKNSENIENSKIDNLDLEIKKGFEKVRKEIAELKVLTEQLIEKK